MSLALCAMKFHWHCGFQKENAKQLVLKEIFRIPRRFVFLHVCRARDELMAIFQNPPGDEGGIFKYPTLKVRSTPSETWSTIRSVMEM